MVIYRGLIVTSCEIQPVKSDAGQAIKNGDEVTFTKFSPNGKKAVFLRSIRVGDAGEFIATFVSDETAARCMSFIENENIINRDTSPLFCIHGFNVHPADVLNKMEAIRARFIDKGLIYFPIPVIWPCNTNGSYPTDQDEPSQGAGKDLKALVDRIDRDLFPRKSLLMHSMGNHVVFDGACGFKNEQMEVIDSAPDVQFENIFMVAADLPHDIFWKEPWEYDNAWIAKERRKRLYGQKYKKASNFFKMLETGDDGKPKGKIYIIYNPQDNALHGSSWGVNFETRLGSLGHMKDDDEHKIRPDLKDYIESHNILPRLRRWTGDDRKYWHSYQFESTAIEYYFSKDLHHVHEDS